MEGLLLAVAAAALFGLSTVFQKKAMGKMGRFSVAALLRNRQWVVAVLFGLAGLAGYLAALRSARLSTVQPVMAVAFLIPVMAGPLLFKERLPGWKWGFVALALAGVVLVSVS